MFNVGTFPDLSIHPIDTNIGMRHLRHNISNHTKNDSLLMHNFPAPLVYLLSHTLRIPPMNEAITALLDILVDNSVIILA